MNNELKHYGVLGMKWGVRRYQNLDGTLTDAGRKRYYTNRGGYTKAGWNAKERAYRKAKQKITEQSLNKNVSKETLNKAKNSIKESNDAFDKMVEYEYEHPISDKDYDKWASNPSNGEKTIYYSDRLTALYYKDKKFKKLVDKSLSLSQKATNDTKAVVDELLSNIGQTRLLDFVYDEKDLSPFDAEAYHKLWQMTIK